MNPFYAEYIATAKILAKARGWDLVCDDQGKVSKDTRWNLTELVGISPPPTLWLGQIGVDPVAFGKLNEIRRRMNQQPLVSGPMPQHWRSGLRSSAPRWQDQAAKCNAGGSGDPSVGTRR